MNEQIEYRVTMTKQHAAALQQALEIVGRAGMGQFVELADMFGPQDGTTIYDHGQNFEIAARAMLIPDLPGRCYYGIRNDKTPKVSKLAWELLEGFRHTTNRCEGLSGLPLPIVEVIE